jgi:hypothetical protein
MRFSALVLSCLAASVSLFADEKPTAVPHSALERLLEAQDVQRMTGETMAALEAQHAEVVAKETDPARRQRKQATHQKVAALLRERFAWPNLKPMAVAAYGETLAPEMVDELLAFYATPTGRLTTTKLHPSLVQAALQSMQHLEKSVETILEEPAGAKKVPTAAWKPANGHEKVAGELATELVKTAFDERIQGIEEAMMANLALIGGGDAAKEMPKDAREGIAAMAARIRETVTFDMVKPLIVQRFVADLSEQEITVLLADSRRPERQAQRAALRRADVALQARVQAWVMEKVMPDMMEIVMSGLKSELEALPPTE